MIKLIKSTFFDEDATKQKLAQFIIKAEQLSFGPQCETFENRFAEWQKRKYCVFVNSGSSANLAIIQALLNLGKLKPNDAVGFSALTWSTNVMPLMELGLKPVPIDVELDTLNVSSSKLLEVLKKHKLQMVFLTNLLGFCDDIDVIRNICKKEKIILIEDNCESLGTKYKGQLLGNFGKASTFSFYVGHHMSTIEGGAICTNDAKLADMLRIVRAHGWDRNLNRESQTAIRNKHKVNITFYSRYTFYENGYNLRPTEINGYIGNIQLKHLTTIINERKKNFLTIAKHIYSQPEKYYPIRYDHLDFVSNFAIPIVCRTQKIRDDLVEKCTDIIELRPIVGGDMTKQPFFMKHSRSKKITQNTNASLIHKQGLYIGNNPELTSDEVNTIISTFS